MIVCMVHCCQTPGFSFIRSPTYITHLLRFALTHYSSSLSPPYPPPPFSFFTFASLDAVKEVVVVAEVDYRNVFSGRRVAPAQDEMKRNDQ